MATIIVGAGPTGLTLATYLPGPIILLERESTIGGCHRVRRDTNGYFSEHGPRVYNKCYHNMKYVLQDLGLAWDDVFVKASFSPEYIDGRRWYSHLSVYEIFVLTLHALLLLVIPRYGRRTSLKDMGKHWNFSEKSMRYIDQVCRNSDGAGIDRYSLYEFLHGFYDHLGPFYEPKRALDTLLFPHWRQVLERKGVDIRCNTAVKSLIVEHGRAVGVRLQDGSDVRGSTVLFAVPPSTLAGIVRRSNLREPWLDMYAERTEYDEYFSVTFHFPKYLSGKLLNHEGLKSTPWGLVYIDMSNYLTSENTAVLSVAATRLDVPSPATGKTLHQCNMVEALREILRQLPLTAKVKEHICRIVPSSGLHKGMHRWSDVDEAYVASADSPPMQCALTSCDGAYSIGCHNGRGWYAFTSFESAVANALAFVGSPAPITPWTLVYVARLMLFFFIFGMAYYLYTQSKSK
jgi:hypothetical protein